MSKHHGQSVADKERANATKRKIKTDIAEWQEKADITDYDDEDGSKYDEIALKILVDEARTLLLRASLSL